ncbi:hypothetical protein FHR81_001857 [Actinoalloteichus hoggarensis]|uniref:Uncharacterized protein n=1 Tax=Actinoalloteichus hoggarensis TaxID=1470176 RepID=A0A221W4W3_9PSEU|nr:hypothetical protein AHOG_16310 [Actinoalloteichus hoggarensis]MBB5920819.1 hypothetical protein [Actinoalloteichus hoggarensis]
MTGHEPCRHGRAAERDRRADPCRRGDLRRTPDHLDGCHARFDHHSSAVRCHVSRPDRVDPFGRPAAGRPGHAGVRRPDSIGFGGPRRTRGLARGALGGGVDRGAAVPRPRCAATTGIEDEPPRREHERDRGRMNARASDETSICLGSDDRYVAERGRRLTFHEDPRPHATGDGAGRTGAVSVSGLAVFRRRRAPWFSGRDRLVVEEVERLDERRSTGGALMMLAQSGGGPRRCGRARSTSSKAVPCPDRGGGPWCCPPPPSGHAHADGEPVREAGRDGSSWTRR